MSGRARKRFALGDLLTLMVSLSVVAWGIQWLVDPGMTPMKVVRVEGELRYLKPTDLEAAVKKVSQGGFFTVDVQAVKQAAESLPWVAKATVRRVWPEALHVHVVEQTPFARWGTKRLVNPEGVPFEFGETGLPEGLPVLAGPDGSGKRVVERYHHVNSVLAPLAMKVARLELSERGAWTLQTDSGIVVQLGIEAFDLRLGRFVKAYPLLTKERVEKMVTVDTRYANGMAVKWAEKVEAKGSTS